MRPSAWRALAALAAGSLWGLCFARDPHALLSLLGLPPLLLLLGGPRPALLGWLHGFAFWLTSIYWIGPTLATFGSMPRPLAGVLLFLACGYLALFTALFAALGARLWRMGGRGGESRRLGWWRLSLLPALWVAVEWLRTYFPIGFPWNLAAYAWIAVPGALAASAWVGAYGISFLVLSTSTAVAMTVERRRWQPLAAGLALPLVLLPLAGRWSLRLAHGEDLRAIQVGYPVHIVQPNIPNQTDYDALEVARNYRRLLDLSRPACQPGSLVIWPESAAWPFLYPRDALLAADLGRLNDHGCAVLFNTSVPVGGSYYNSAFLLVPGQAPVRYDKRHLVPFGEYVPFKGLFGWMDKLARNAGDYRPADRLTLLPWLTEKLGVSICFEVTFPDEVAALVRSGATALVTITNDAWYGDTFAPWQHFRAVRFRAAENRRPLLRGAITGVSAVVAPDGTVLSQIGVFREGVLAAHLAGESALTPYTRAPWLVPALCALLALVGLALAPGRAQQRSPSPGEGDGEAGEGARG
jgi:apolipoprotein N-acyltransferase